MFDYEKDRAKWQLERDSLVNMKQEQGETIERLTVRKEQLLRENEKLRNDNKGSKKYLFSNSSNYSQQSSQQTSQSASATRYMLTKSISGAGQQNILSHAINKAKENAAGSGPKYIGGGAMIGSVSLDDDTGKNTTPNSKKNRYQ